MVSEKKTVEDSFSAFLSKRGSPTYARLEPCRGFDAGQTDFRRAGAIA